MSASVGAGTEGVYDRVEFKYNRQGQLIWKKDQNGTIHEFDYDDLGRQTQDRVTTVGTGVDDAVLRIGKSYEVRGMVDTISSYDAATNGDTVNQVVFEYDDASLLSKEYQEHSGAKDANTPYVGYNHDTSTSSGQFTKGLRPTSLRYPNGRLVHYTYSTSGSTADALNRIAAIKDDDSGSPGDSLAEYQYLGQTAIVQVDYPEPNLRYDLAHGTGNDPHDGPMDRFGRVTDLLWRNHTTSTDAVRIQHGYDRAGNRLYREDPVAAANGKDFDELYTYDGVNQLNTFQRGDLNANKDGLVGATKTFAQDWSLDPTGNWSTFKEDDDGDSTWDLNQSRTSNKSNEITDITETAGPAWATPAYNRAGNMTSIPSPNDATTVYTATYDAWNRLVKLEEGEDMLAEYAYDGRTFRTLKKTYAAGQLVETRHFHYNSGWQVLEERIGTSTHPDRHFLWGPRYIDDLLLRDRDTSDPKNGTLNERLYSLQDPNWNVIALTTPNGTIQERHAYTAYGTPAFLTPTFGTRATSNHAWEILYAGYHFDSETAMYQVRHRVLRPQLGWVQRDPIGYRSGDTHLYRYVRNQPIIGVDPLGKEYPRYPRCCLDSFEFKSLGPGMRRRLAPSVPGQKIDPTDPRTYIVTGYDLIEPFSLTAKFRHDDKDCCWCKCCEYRQYVRGAMIVDGQEFPMTLPGGNQLEVTEFHEDGFERNGITYRPGHRDLPSFDGNRYSKPHDPNADPMKHGCEFVTIDTPGLLNAPSGTHAIVLLEFKGQIIDVCMNGLDGRPWVRGEKKWSVRFDLTAP